VLVLTRRAGESIVIGDDVRVVVLDVRGDTVRLGIEAPRSIQVHRAEVYAEVQAANAAAAAAAGEDIEGVAERLRRLARPVVPRPASPGRRPAERRAPEPKDATDAAKAVDPDELAQAQAHPGPPHLTGRPGPLHTSTRPLTGHHRPADAGGPAGRPPLGEPIPAQPGPAEPETPRPGPPGLPHTPAGPKPGPPSPSSPGSPPIPKPHPPIPRPGPPDPDPPRPGPPPAATVAPSSVPPASAAPEPAPTGSSRPESAASEEN
jgi:carbon storage regulator